VRVTFLGVRGSIPVSDAAMLGVGGHTSAVAVAHDGASPTLVLDAGTGLRQWGRHVGPAPFRGTVVLGHLHWDHIIGLPFFRAADHPEAETTVLVPAQPGGGPEALLERMMSPPAFPVVPTGLRGRWGYESYDEGTARLEGFDVSAREIPHKGGRTMGLRVSDGTSTLAYLSDHAPQDFGPGDDGTGALHEAALELAAGADLLIHDAQYTKAELPIRGHFGHAAAEYAVKLADAAGARRVLLFHHDPDRTDDQVEVLADAARATATVHVDVAREGVSVMLDMVPGGTGE
jgi:phosphoribosyl 1,2-cyclic phosphodiesterase